jgi:hypothetical protein
MVTRPDYTEEKVAAAKSVMVELFHLLGEYRDQIVLIGGWVPSLLVPDRDDPHVGSLDVDLALDHRGLADAGYQSIAKLLESREYEKDKDNPFKYWRTVELGGRPIRVELDLMAGQYGGTGKSHRTQKVQGIQPRKARGCDIAFEAPIEVVVEGELPGGGRDRASVRVTPIVPFLVMKAMALSDRLKEKDAYDIYYCIRHYPGGITALAEAFRPLAGHGLVREALGKIREKFATPSHIGPKHVADFYGVTDPDARAILLRDASERVMAWAAAVERVG